MISAETKSYVCSYILVVPPELFPSSQVESVKKKIETCIIISNTGVFFQNWNQEKLDGKCGT